MAVMIAILMTCVAVILLFSIIKLTKHHTLPEVLLCWAVSGLLSGVLWVASVGHFYYAWQLPQGKIQQDVTISGRVVSGGCVSGVDSVQEAAYQYVVVIESVNRESTATFLDDGIFSSLFKRVVTNTFSFKARLNHQHYEFANDGIVQLAHSQEDDADIIHQAADERPEKTRILGCLHNGDTFTAVAKLKPAYSTANPVGASRQQQLVSQFIHASGYIKSIKQDKTKHYHSVRYGLATTLQKLDLVHERWWRALLLGDKTGFTLDDWALLQRTGTGHIFSISGMHLSLIAGVCLILFHPIIFLLVHVCNALERTKYFLKIKTTLGFQLEAPGKRNQYKRRLISTEAPIRKIVLICLVFNCFFYALLSGSALPVVRALILLVVGCILSLSRTAWRPVNIALSMLTLSLLLFPLSILSASFYLSIGAVVCIWFLVVIWGLQRAPWYVSLFKLQIALTVIMMPLTLIWFGSASIIAIIANLIALPVITLLLPICLLCILIHHFFEFIPALHLSSMLLQKSDVYLGYLLSLLNGLSEFSLSAINIHISNGAAFCLIVALIVLLLPTWRYKAICVTLLMLPLFSTIQKWLPTNERVWALHVFDAGQASAIAVTKGGRAIIIDSGAKFNGIAHTATKHLLPFLESRHISNVDVVIHTHSDNDHAGGAQAIKQHPLAVNAAFHSPTFGCERGKRMRWQNLTISFLWPPKGNNQDNNAMSCVVKITGDSGSVLIPGDIEKASEYALITRDINEETSVSSSKLKADILIAPHHGSKTSSTNVFIEHVAPKVVIFTQGFENRWQFPATDVTKRYANSGVKQYLTSYHGYIKATFDKESFYIDTQRGTLHKRWYLPGIAPRHLNK